MVERFDVVVAGAGPAGAQCARDLAARGYEVLVLETESEDGFPQQSNKSTGGTFPRMLSGFGIPDDVVMHFTDQVVLESPNESLHLDQTGAVLDFPTFKRFLVDDGRQRGATYWFDSRVASPIVEDGHAVGVRYNGGQEVYADVVIDATGPGAPLAKALDVVALERDRLAVGVEWELDGVTLDHPEYADIRDAMMIRLDREYAPGGYAWVFHTGAEKAKVGICYLIQDAYRDESDGRRLDEYLEHWLQTDPRFQNATRLGDIQHRGSAHIQPPGQMSAPGFMAIGDTVPSVDPVWGEGIHKGMESARAAATTVDTCLTGTVDTSADAMGQYEMRWHRDVAPKAYVRLLLTELLYSIPDERYDQLMRDLDRLGQATRSKTNRGHPLAVAKLLHLSDLPLAAQTLQDRPHRILELLSGILGG